MAVMWMLKNFTETFEINEMSSFRHTRQCFCCLNVHRVQVYIGLIQSVCLLAYKMTDKARNLVYIGLVVCFPADLHSYISRVKWLHSGLLMFRKSFFGLCLLRHTNRYLWEFCHADNGSETYWVSILLQLRLCWMCLLELAARIPPSGYCQFIPPRDASGCHFPRHGPPALPPHLLQSVLNADLPEHVSCAALLVALEFSLLCLYWYGLVNCLILFVVDCVPLSSMHISHLI